MHLDPTPAQLAIALLVMFGFVVTGLVVGSAIAVFLLKHKINRGTRPEASSLADARVGVDTWITGTVLDTGLTLHGPLTGRLCAWYQVNVWPWRGGYSPLWRISTREEGTDVLVDDGTDVARVRLAAARLELRYGGVETRSHAFDPPTPAEAALSERHLFAPLRLIRSRRYVEYALLPGDRVQVLGRVRRGSSTGAAFEVEAGPSGQLVVSRAPDAV